MISRIFQHLYGILIFHLKKICQIEAFKTILFIFDDLTNFFKDFTEIEFFAWLKKIVKSEISIDEFFHAFF